MTYGKLDRDKERYRLAEEETVRRLREGLARLRRQREIDLRDEEKRDVIVLSEEHEPSR